MKSLFVTGTDTDVGKTYVTCALIEAFAAHGLRARPMKPVAAGTIFVDGVAMNADVAALREVSGSHAPLADINPYCFAEPIAPHLAAHHEGVAVELHVIAHAFERIKADADIVLVEGAGGFLVPLSERQSMAEIPAALGLNVILVVGMRLGVLNHALLTAEAIRSRGLTLAGWIANTPVADAAMLALDENLAALARLMGAPQLGIVPYDTHANSALEHARRAANFIFIDPLLNN